MGRRGSISGGSVIATTDTVPAGTVTNAPKVWSGTAWVQGAAVTLSGGGATIADDGAGGANIHSPAGEITTVRAGGAAGTTKLTLDAATSIATLTGPGNVNIDGGGNAIQGLIGGNYVLQLASATWRARVSNIQVEEFQAAGTASTQNRLPFRFHGCVTTTDAATATAVTGLTYTIPASSAIAGRVFLSARETTGHTATTVSFRFAAHRAGAGAVLDGSGTAEIVGAAGLATVAAAAVASGNTIEIRVNGVAATTIDWQGRCEFEEN